MEVQGKIEWLTAAERNEQISETVCNAKSSISSKHQIANSCC